MATAQRAMKRTPQVYTRFSLYQRIEHGVMLVAFTALALTGLPQKFAEAGVSQWIIAFLGGIESVRIIHRVFATVLMVATIYHLMRVGYDLFVLRKQPAMLPMVKDMRDMWEKVLFNLGLRKTHPKLPRFNADEKMEYWAFVWGTLVMVLTGFMLWNPIATARFLPGQFIPAAKVAHGAEATLAVLAIIVWHFYSVHLKQFNKSMWTGKMERPMMQEEHAAELEDIEAGRVWTPPAPAAYKKRMQVFVPVAAVISALLLAGVIWFVTFEQTAIETIPPYEIEVVPPELEQ